jgi:hypothetical protein
MAEKAVPDGTNVMAGDRSKAPHSIVLDATTVPSAPVNVMKVHAADELAWKLTIPTRARLQSFLEKLFFIIPYEISAFKLGRYCA